MFIRPLQDRVLIEPLEVEQKSAGGIVLAGADAKINYLHGKVIAKGPGKQKATGEHVPIPLELGDVVIYGNVSSTLEDMVDGKKVFLVEQNAIVGIIFEDSDHAHLSSHIQEHIVSEEPQQEVYKDDFVPLVPSTPTQLYIGTDDGSNA